MLVEDYCIYGSILKRGRCPGLSRLLVTWWLGHGAAGTSLKPKTIHIIPHPTHSVTMPVSRCALALLGVAVTFQRKPIIGDLEKFHTIS